jgi:hypothetical protein
VPLAQINASVAQGTDGFGRPVGVITLNQPQTPGVWYLTVMVTDTLTGLSDQKVAVVSVGTFVNHPPEFRILPPSEIFAVAGQTLNFGVEGQDLDVGETVNITMVNAPTGATYAGLDAVNGAVQPGNRIKVGGLCNSVQNCCQSDPAACSMSTDIVCNQLGPNLPNTCNDTTTNAVCSPTHPCQKGYFNWTPSAQQAGQAFVIHFNATDSNVQSPITAIAETIIHVAPQGNAPIQIYGVVPNHGPPALLNNKVGTSCTNNQNQADVSMCNAGTGVPPGMACLPVQGGANHCVDTAHLVTVYGQGFTGTVSATIGGTPVLNLSALGTTAITFNTPPGSLGPAVDVSVTNGGNGTATLLGGFKYACPSNLCANSNDTNFAGSNACAFVTQYPGCTNTDSDLDGFSDAQEAAGYIDIDCDGVQTVADLPLPGASNGRRDIYVKYDWMAAGPTEIPANTDHKPFETCTVGVDCAQKNPNYPLTQCGWQNPPSGAIPNGTVIPGAWDRVVAAFNAHTTLTQAQTLDYSNAYTLHLTDLTGFPQASNFYPLSVKVVTGSGPQAVVCTGMPDSHTLTNCLGGQGSAAASARVYIGAPGTPTEMNLHVLKGQAVTHHWVTTFGPLGNKCTVGSPVVRAGHDYVDFYQEKTQNLMQVDGLAYHYMLFTHFSNCDGCDTCTPAGQTAAGCGSAGVRDPSCPSAFNSAPVFQAGGISTVYGPDSIISMGEFPFNCTEQTIRQQAGTIGHELGHNLSLNHGGLDNRNNKANYQSIMNYQYQFPGLITTAANSAVSVVNFSEKLNGHLDETALYEENSIPYSPADTNPYFVMVWDQNLNNGYYPAPGNSFYLDWNSDYADNSGATGSCDPTETDGLVCADDIFTGTPPDVSCVDTGVPDPNTGLTGACREAVDINQDGALTDLSDSNDWGSLNLLFQCSAAYLPGAPQCSDNAASAYAYPLHSNCLHNAEFSINTAILQNLSGMPPYIVPINGTNGNGNVLLAQLCVNPASQGTILINIPSAPGFDATTILLATLRAGNAPIANLGCSLHTNTTTGLKDQQCHFRPADMGIKPATKNICIKGKLANGQVFSGCTPLLIKGTTC